MYVLLQETDDPQWLMEKHSYSLHFVHMNGKIAYDIDDATQSAIEEGGYIYVDDGVVVIEETQRQ